MTRRVLVTGARAWTDTATIREALAAQWGDGTATLIVGASPRGADMLAEQCWRAWGGRVERHPANWQRDGRSAGFKRNAAMVATGADVCLAFLHGPSRGTRHTAELAARAGIPTHHFQHPDRAGPGARSAPDTAPVTAADADRRSSRPKEDQMTLDDPHTSASAGPPTTREIADLLARLRHLHSPDATEAERAAFLTDKHALLARIPDHACSTDTSQADPIQAEAEAVMARAAAGGYAMVGPSARTWSVDPATGVPTGPVSEAEHRLVRDLIAHERLDGAEPVWWRCADGGEEIVAAVIPARPDLDDLDDLAARAADERPPPVGPAAESAAAPTPHPGPPPRQFDAWADEAADAATAADAAVAHAHDALTSLREGTADHTNHCRTADAARVAEPTPGLWDEHGIETAADTADTAEDAAAEDDGSGWSP